MDVETLAKSRYLSLTTFRRDGTPVATPVWLARQGDELVTSSGSLSGKAKRLRNSSRVLVAPCDMRGRVTGEAVEGTARLQDQAETAVTISLIRKRYGLQARLAFWWSGRHAETRPTGARVGIAIRLSGPAQA
jgi:PPOX class probable F420-dependent enzyme